jgi:hypothetical protein
MMLMLLLLLMLLLQGQRQGGGEVSEGVNEKDGLLVAGSNLDEAGQECPLECIQLTHPPHAPASVAAATTLPQPLPLPLGQGLGLGEGEGEQAATAVHRTVKLAREG